MAENKVNKIDNLKSDKLKEIETKENEPADFEKAITATGFGTFNLLLLFISIPATFGSVFESTTMSFTLPVAECDLKLTLVDKGILNAVTYGGMIVSAVAWGYLADTKGRKKVLAYGYLIDAVCVFGSALSQNFTMLVIFKFFGGLVVNGPGAVLYTYLTEFHGGKHRPMVLMVLGVVNSGAALALPLLAWGTFPRDWDFVLFDVFVVRTWQIFLAVCAIPSLISGAFFLMLPESPRFLMSQGRNSDALRVFRKIYAINTRKPEDTYEIQKLIEEVPSRESNVNEVIYTIEQNAKKSKQPSRTVMESLRAGMQQMKPMFRKPLLGRSIQCYMMQFCLLLGLNTIRLWLPQLFASLAEYEALNTGVSADMCVILEYSVNKSATAVASAYANINETETCTAAKNVSVDMYTNNLIVGLSGLVGYLFAGILVRAIGGKKMLTLGLLASGIFGMALYWSTSGLTTVILSSIYTTVAGIAAASLIGSVVALFPTQLRTLIVAITMMFGRLGALSGNLLFPVFIQIGCIPPFLMVCFVLLFAAALSLLLPNPNKTAFT